MLSDSKGNYIKNHVRSKVGQAIRWWSVKGLTTKVAVDWLFEKIDTKVRKYGPISLYVWLGTCDFTTKRCNTVTLDRKLSGRM